jgi:ABC-type proline/glycine betaine transport system ATPase subunit
VDLASGLNVAVLLVTHDLHEAAAVATSIVIIKKGTVVTRVDGPNDASALERIFTDANE